MEFWIALITALGAGGIIGHVTGWLRERPKALADAEVARADMLLKTVNQLRDRITQLEKRIDDDRTRYDSAMEELRSENSNLRNELHEQKIRCVACQWLPPQAAE